jgi:trigger factor
LDDDFAQEVSEFETIEELKESLAQRFQESSANETKNSIHAAILAELVKTSRVDLPQTLIEKEVDLILTQTAAQMQQYGMDIKQLFNSQSIPKMRENARPEAMQRLKQSLILQEIAKAQSLQPEAEAVEAKVKELVEKFGDRDLDLERLRDMVQEDLLSEKTLNWLQEKTTVELVPKGSLEEAESQEEDTEETLSQTEEE